jgi:hypothetical protein
MTIDQGILRALQSGPITVDEILRRLEAPVRTKLAKLRVRGVVMREGRGGAHRKFTFTLLHPDRAATALREKGGLAPAVKAASDVRLPAQLNGTGKQRRTFSKRSRNHFRSRRKEQES